MLFRSVTGISGASLIAELAWRKDSLPTPIFLGFPCGSASKESTPAHRKARVLTEDSFLPACSPGKKNRPGAAGSSLLPLGLTPESRQKQAHLPTGQQSVNQAWLLFHFAVFPTARRKPSPIFQIPLLPSDEHQVQLDKLVSTFKTVGSRGP